MQSTPQITKATTTTTTTTTTTKQQSGGQIDIDGVKPTEVQVGDNNNHHTTSNFSNNNHQQQKQKQQQSPALDSSLAKQYSSQQRQENLARRQFSERGPPEVESIPRGEAGGIKTSVSHSFADASSVVFPPVSAFQEAGVRAPLEKSISQNDGQRGQRIKVTLSAPRNSGDLQSESLLVQDSASQLPSDSSLSNIQLLSGTSRNSSVDNNNNNENNKVRRRQSSSTGSGVQVAIPTTSTPKSQPLSREQQENLLRRIASERRQVGNRKNCEPIEQVVKPEKNNQDKVESASPVQSQQQQPQQQVLQQQESCSSQKQLAIYINGKIRSNSIFCRSNSSNSFNSILNRFHNNNLESAISSSGGGGGAGGGGGGGGGAGERLKGSGKVFLGDKNSPLRLCLQGKLADKFRGRDVSKEPNKRKRRRRRRKEANRVKLISELSQGARNLIANYLPLASRGAKATPLLIARQPSEEVQKRKRKSSSSSETSTSSSGQEEEEEGGEAAEGAGPEETTKASYKLNPSSMFLRKAMRYYRLWIYCTNITIFLGTLIFILSTIYVLSDYRIKLLVSPSPSISDGLGGGGEVGGGFAGSGNIVVSRTEPGQQEEGVIYKDNYIFGSSLEENGEEDEKREDREDRRKEFDIQISHTEPYVILAYVAIAIQAGLLQAIGCFGAIRMKERWIQTFWYLILALTLFDGVFLLYWLNRYDFIVNSLKRNMSFRLRENYGFANVSALQNGSSIVHFSHAAADSNLDKIITEVMDKIQSDFQCCGISSASDYKEGRWRRAKLAQLSERLNWDSRLNSQLADNETQIRANLLRLVPLVPASCCRRRKLQTKQTTGKRPVILDDSKLAKPIRVPAWSPSMVVETIEPLKNVKLPARRPPPLPVEAAPPLEEGAGRNDKSYEGSDNSIVFRADKEEPVGYYDSTNDYNGSPGMQPANNNNNEEDYNSLLLSKQQRRLLAKQTNFARKPQKGQPDNNNNRRRRNDIEMGPSSEPEVARRWSTVDSEGRVLSWLAAAVERLSQVAANSSTGEIQISAGPSGSGALDDLASLRQMLFKPNQQQEEEEEEEYFENKSHFIWPNRLRLTFDQYKLVEGYLLTSSSKQPPSQSNSSHHSTTTGETKRKRSIFSVFSSNNNNSTDAFANKPADLALLADEDANRKHIAQLKAQLASALKEDPAVSCAPRGYLDQTSIYTHGCQPHIRAWLDSSAHILFVTGFCVLTVLKFCSVLLLRLEIREMIHKIRVLKGMATEYNALHDLEAYLPRPSVCAQAAELTPSGVAAAVPVAPTGPTSSSIGSGSALLAATATGLNQPVNNSNQTSNNNPHYRLGGSFSEAVVAATAAAASGTSNPGIAGSGLCTSGLAATGRAASMKAMAAVSSMLTTPEFCTARSSSAHLCTGSLMAGTGTGRHACSLRSSDFLSQAHNLMSRRHTAVSVCPSAAAAAVAAAAAQHLISRRGTYVQANNNSNNLLNLSGLNLNQHRHSAVPTPFDYQFCPAHGSSLLAPRGLVLGGRSPATLQQQQSSDSTTTTTSRIPHQSSLEAGAGANPSSSTSSKPPTQSKSNRSPSSGSHQLLSLMYPFKRQASGGAQSAGNFSLDLSPVLSTESRRSIH